MLGGGRINGTYVPASSVHSCATGVGAKPRYLL